MRPYLLQWFHKKAPKLRQGAPQISRRRDDVRLMMNARSRWCLDIRHPKWKEIEKEGKHVWASQRQRPPLVIFFGHRQRPSYHILHTYRRIRGQRATEDFSSVRQHSAKAAAENSWRWTLDSITLTRRKVFHTKGKRRKSSYSILTGKTFGDIDSYLLLLVFLWKCSILTEKMCELRACLISHFAWLI